MAETETVPENCEIFDGFVCQAYLRRLFAKSDLTIDLWRKHKGLPYVLLPGDVRNTIRYRRMRVIKWAKRNGVKMVRSVRKEDPNLVPRFTNEEDGSKNGNGSRRYRREFKKLPLTERRQVAAHLGAMMPSDEVSNDAQLAHKEISEILCRVGFRPLPPVYVLLRGPLCKAFKEGCKTLMEFIDENTAPKNQLEKISVLATLIEMVVAYLKQCRIPVSPRTILQQLSNIDSIVDDELPGYRACKMLRVVLSQNFRRDRKLRN